MHLVEEWRVVAAKAWSFRLAILGGGFSAMAAALPYVAPAQPSMKFALLMFGAQSLGALFSLASATARLVKQPVLRDACADIRKDGDGER